MVLTLFGLMWVSGLGLAGCFILYRRASEVWITEDSVVVRWLRKERRIAFKEIEEVKFSHGCPVTLKVRNGKDVFFFPRGCIIPIWEAKNC